MAAADDYLAKAHENLAGRKVSSRTGATIAVYEVPIMPACAPESAAQYKNAKTRMYRHPVEPLS